MATTSFISLSASFLPFQWKDGKVAEVPTLRGYLCSVRSRPTRKSSSSSSSPPGVSSAPKKVPVAKEPPSPPKKRHWKEGKFPGVSESSIAGFSQTPIKNVKKKIDDRAAAKAWACTVTEALSERIQKKQWDRLGLMGGCNRSEDDCTFVDTCTSVGMEVFFPFIRMLHTLDCQVVRAGELFETMVEEGIEPTSALYTALLAAYCRCNILDKAFSILTKMKTLPLCQPDVFTYSTLLKACVEASRFELIDTLYQDMRERMIVPNTVTQNIVLGDVWTMNIIMGLFSMKGEIDMMEKWYEKFRSIGIEPETRTFNILISVYGRKRMYDKITLVMEYMRKLAFPWTTSTYNNIIEAFASVGDVKSMEYAFDQMRAEGMKADTNTFRYLITGYGNSGLFHKVVSSIKLAERFEIPHNTSFYNAVIYACSKAGDLTEMERVFKCMKERHYMPDSTTYSILVETYRKEGMNDKIYNLEQEEGRSFGIKLFAE
ncbi:hypothetical protein M5K25_001517 [Dendrobium thyrsiflorum]|uniref:Pentatricopeptide repeat-containing protein n=1 Tax=Dendrobium thyrsiflorum TaxID=117978 RepID=A0ABD0VQA4_DENTH